jgi:hypothetical protein
MPKRLTYIQRASRIFLLGTRYQYPAQAVEAGIRTLEEWTDTLNQLRQAELERDARVRSHRIHQRTRLENQSQ